MPPTPIVLAENNQVFPAQNQKIDLINSALLLSKRKIPKQEEEATRSIPLFEEKILAFQFRDKEIKKGQYRVPFSFKLP
jgi:hypothetical protein